MLPHLLLPVALTFFVQDPAAPGQGAKPAVKLVVGQPAPPIDAESWIQPRRRPVAELKNVESAGGKPAGKPGEFDKLAKSDGTLWSRWHAATIVYRAPLPYRIPLLADLANANDDRQLELVGLCEAQDSDAAKGELANAGVKAGLAQHAQGCPYWDSTLELFVLGPSGELVWMGNATDEKELLDAVETALERVRAVPLHGLFPEELNNSLADYWAGRYDKARAVASKLVKKHEKAGGEREIGIWKAAGQLVDAINQQEKDLCAAVEGQGGMRVLSDLVELDEILSKGFQGASAKRAAEKIADSKKDLMGGSLDDAKKWMELARKRPLFFPVREDGGGAQYAKELEQFVKRSANVTAPQQRASALVERWNQRKGK